MSAADFTLGLFMGHDQAAAVVENGRVVRAMEEERPTRQKHFGPAHGRAPDRTLAWLESEGYGKDAASVVSFGTPLPGGDMKTSVAFAYGRSATPPPVPPTQSYNHHRCHIATAAVWSDWDDCYVLAIDGGGHGEYGMAARVRNGTSIDVLGVDSMDSTQTITHPGGFYLQATASLGFGPLRDEGKVMCLAATGDPAVYRHLFDRYRIEPFRVTDKTQPGIHRDFAFTPKPEVLWDLLGKDVCTTGQSRADLAAAIQETFERMILADVEAFVPPGAKLAVAGGSFANVVINRLLVQKGYELFVAPPMNDGGIAAGAALLAANAQPYWLDDVYLGVDAGEVPTSGDKAVSPTAVAKMIADGAVVGLCQGRCEYGPRALGNRSILFDPRRAEIAVKVNTMLRRSGFMPFAPAMLYGHASLMLEDGWQRAAHAMNFMTVSWPVKPEWRERLQGVVHVDGTCRPQFVSGCTNPFYEEVIKAFGDLTSVYVIGNTSYNIHESPIVCDLAQARADFEAGACDVLVCADGLVTR